MIKMFIGNEEVVSNHEFTIKEEMLSASSTILNNCYPKSWELTKDYVSNFYYPKDYSKFILASGEFEHGDEEYSVLNVSGEKSIQFETNVEEEWNSFNVYGNTYQETSESPIMPSPDYPSELVSVGYTNLFNKDDYNLLNACYIDGTGKVVYGNNNKLTWLKLQPNTTYTITQTKVSYVTRRLALFSNDLVANAQGTLIATFTETTAIKQTFTTTDTNVYLGWVYCNLANLNNTTEQEMLDSIQITQGTQAHSYIPYGKYGIEVKTAGKNLFDLENKEETLYGVTTNINHSEIVFNGTKSANSNTIAKTSIGTLKAGKYTFSYSKKSGAYTSLSDEFTLYAGSTKVVIISLKRETYTNSFTIDTDTEMFAQYWVNSGSSFNNYDIVFQLEENTQATEYEPYKSNTYLYTLDNPLRSIGDTKDLLYIKNGMLYVDRKIGNIVLNGSENWDYNSGNSVFVCKNLVNYSLQNFAPYCNNYKGINIVLAYKQLNNNEISFLKDSSNNRILIKDTRYTIASDLQTWLSTHNTEVQYVLETPYTEEIGQVNIPYSYEGINNTTFDTGIDTEETVYYYWNNFNVLFAGIVKNSGDISLNPRYPHYCSLQILDYKTFLSESNTLDFVIANKTVKEAINMVVNAVKNYGFVVGDINISGADDIIGAYSTLNKSAYDVLQYLASISGSRWRARYINSSTMAIDFYDPDTLPQAEDIEYTKEYWENNNIVDMTFNYGTRDYRNKQILLSDEVYANINYDETLISNGYSNTFTVQNNIGLVVSVIVNNEEKTVRTNNDKQMGIDADFYYTPGKNIIESNVIYPASTLIHLTYQPLVKGRQIVYNNSEVDRISRQTDTEGVIARYETRNDILSSDELEKIAQTYIEYKGKAEVILTLKTQNKDLYNIGEVVYFNAPIDELKQNYMVKTKQIEYVVINDIINLFYIYEMTSSFNSEKAINYFDNQRNKASGNIADGESITRNIDIETEVGIIWTEGSVSSASVTVTGDNLLNSALNSPFVE